MKKVICKKLYDTDVSEVVRKTSVGTYGDPAGYEETLYRTAEGNYFVYTNGGEASPYKKEDIKRLSKAAAETWLSEHS